MRYYGKDIDSVHAWDELTADYSRALAGDYHSHRLSVIAALIPPDLYEHGRSILDFGCGDGCLFESFLTRGSQIRGFDISPQMIAFARDRLKSHNMPEELAQVGGVEALSSIPTASLDAILSFNVLAYLTDKEEQLFYREAARVLREAAYLVVTHSNELFDMFSLNAFTIGFLGKHLVSDDTYRSQLPALLTHPGEPEGPSYNVRENPLSYRHKLLRYGFKEVRQEFINLHDAPPLLLHGRHYPDTLHVERESRWKLMFTCSTFGSLSVRQRRHG